MARVRRLSPWELFVQQITGWAGFRLPDGEQVDCPKARGEVRRTEPMDWVHMADHVIGGRDVHQVPRDGIASGMPIQQGTTRTRALWWGRHGESTPTVIPRPTDTLGRYWVTGYPNPWFDRRCIIVEPDGRTVHEIIQFDQDAPKRWPGLPQQAWNYGRFYDGVLVDGRAITASQLPGHLYLWGIASADDPHEQGLVIDNYVGGWDGQLDEGPRCGEWVALDPDSESYARMMDLGGESAARADALARKGARIIDKNGYLDALPAPPPSLITQAGRWTAATNSHLFRVPLADLRRVVG